MNDVAPKPAARTAGHLRFLLRRYDYKIMWAGRAGRTQLDEIHQGAVAEVLASYLRRNADDANDHAIEGRQLKDRVGRALAGRTLSKETLDLFVNAFDMTEDDRRDLVALWTGSSKVFVLAGTEGVPPDVVETLKLPGYRPVSVHEHHVIGEAGLPIRHQTMQVLRALRNGVDRYRYHFDTDAVTVHTGPGCQEVLGPVHEVRPEIFSVDILLAKPLDTDDTISIEYTTTFDYRTAPEPIFRKAVQGRIESVDLRVQFSPRKTPHRIWWTVWETLDGPPVEQVSVDLDNQLTTQRYLEEMENIIAGFRWEW